MIEGEGNVSIAVEEQRSTQLILNESVEMHAATLDNPVFTELSWYSSDTSRISGCTNRKSGSLAKIML